MTKAILAASVVALAACGGSNKQGNLNYCPFTLSGTAAASATDCSASLVYSPATNSTHFRYVVQGTGTPTTVNVDIEIANGDWIAARATNPNQTGIVTSATVMSADLSAVSTGQRWTAAKDHGSFTLVIDSTGAAAPQPNGDVVYVPHGTLDASLAPDTASGAAHDELIHLDLLGSR